ncbi:MAG: energy transducer TonB [Gammaproteobacteria bacterium]|nr:energy transducer TonB [Gammaproteobacteria bacterium]
MNTLLGNGTMASRSDSSIAWPAIGILVSFSLHAGLAIAYLWTPQLNYALPPAAAPITVVIVGTLASPQHQPNDLKQGAEQQESAQQSPSQMEQEHRAELPVADAPVVEVSKLDKTSIFKQAKQQVLEQPKLNKIEPKKTAQLVVKKEPTKVTAKSKNQVATMSQQAMARPTIDVAQESKQTAALQQGQLSVDVKKGRLDWQQILHAHLERAKRYPRVARRMRKQGMPIITFTVNRNGKVLGASLVKSSGIDSLDQEALALTYRAQPLPRPPISVTGEKLTLTLPINFSI